VRIAQLAEAIELIRRMWTEVPASYKGVHYEIADAYCEPRPRPLPPVMVGGSGETYLLRVVAQHADWWNYGYRDRLTYAHKQDVLKRHCREVGRDCDAITQVLRVGILVAETEGELTRLQALPEVRPMEAGRLVGTPDQVTEALAQVIAQGAHRLTVHFADAPRTDGTRLFAAAVLPQLSHA